MKDRELLDALTTAMGKQPGALGIVISDAGADDEHPLSQLIDDGLAGLDPSVYVQLHAAPEDADPLDPKVWRGLQLRARQVPGSEGHGGSRRARRGASRAFMSAFRNLRLNQRVHADERLIGRDDWLACGGEIDLEACAAGAAGAGWTCRAPRT